MSRFASIQGASSSSSTSTATASLRDRVCQAMAMDNIDARSPQFHNIYLRCEERLGKLMGTRQPVLITGANGTEMMEMAIENLIEFGDKVLVINTGGFSSRWLDILQFHQRRRGADGIQGSIVQMDVPTGEQPDLNELKELLESHPDLKACLLVHCETSVGTLVDLPTVADVVRTSHPEILLLVDAMTSIAAHEIEFDQWQIDAMIGASHKVIGATTGIGFVALSPRAWDSCRSERYCKNFQKMLPCHHQGESEFALPLQNLFGLDEALDIIFTDGPARYREQIGQLAETARQFVEEAGWQLVTDTPANAVTCFWVPDSVDAEEVVKQLQTESQSPFSTGRLELANRVIRIGHLGTAGTRSELITSLNRLQACLRQVQYGCEPGSPGLSLVSTVFDNSIPMENPMSVTTLSSPERRFQADNVPPRSVGGLRGGSDSLGSSIAIVPIESIVELEFHRGDRGSNLLQEIQREEVVRNPLVVAEVGGVWVLLDGHHRLASLRALGCTHVPVQQVCFEKDVTIRNWIHVGLVEDPSFFLGDPDERGSGEFRLSGLQVERVHYTQGIKQLGEPDAVGLVSVFGDPNSYLIRDGGTSLGWALCELEDPCSPTRYAHSQVQMLGGSLLDNLFDKEMRSNWCVQFCPFTHGKVRSLATQGLRIPSGITRVVIECGRVLRIDVPLALLKEETSEADRQWWLQQLRESRPIRFPAGETVIEGSRMRHYAESLEVYNDDIRVAG